MVSVEDASGKEGEVKVICSWCQRSLGEKPPVDDSSISHGMCLTCLLQMQEEVNAHWVKEEGKDMENAHWAKEERKFFCGCDIRWLGFQDRVKLFGAEFERKTADGPKCPKCNFFSWSLTHKEFLAWANGVWEGNEKTKEEVGDVYAQEL